jgi:hypothetical protein
MIWLERAYKCGIEIDTLKEIAYSVYNWSQFKDALITIMGDDFIG